MDVTPDLPQGKQIVQSYGDGRFTISGQSYEGSVLVFPDRVVAWPVTSFEEITPESLQAVTEADVGVLLLGCGQRMQLVTKALRDPVHRRNQHLLKRFVLATAGAPAGQRLDLHEAHRVDVRVAQQDRAPQRLVAGQQVGLALEPADPFARALELLPDGRENPRARRAGELRVALGNVEVGFGHRHFGVVEHGRDERPAGGHFDEPLGADLVGQRLQARPEAEPARQDLPALGPGEDPGDRAQVAQGPPPRAPRRSGAVAALLDHVDRRRLGEEVEKAVRFHKRPPGAEAFLADEVHRAHQPRRIVALLQRRAQGAGLQQLEMVGRGHPVGVFLRDRLALFGHAQVAADRPRRQRPQEAVRRPGAPADRPAAAVEEADAHAVPPAKLDQSFLRAVEGPETGDEAAVLAAVAVADHHLQHRRRLPRRLRLPGERAAHDVGLKEGLDHLAAVLQVVDRLQERHDRQRQPGPILIAVQQAGFAREQEDGEQIARAARHADDERAQTLGSVRRDVLGQHAVELDRRPRFGPERGPRRRERARPGEFAAHQLGAALLRPMGECLALRLAGRVLLAHGPALRSPASS